MVELVLFVLGNLAGSFFCSLSEAALLSSSEARIRARVERGDRRAQRLLVLRQDPGKVLSSIVFLNNVFAIAGTAAISAYATQVLPSPTAMLVFISLQTVLIIAFGEITPKVIGEAHPERIAILVAPALVWVRRVLTPLVWLVEHLVGWARPKGRVAAGEEAEIRELARLGEEGGHIESEQAELIRRVFRLDDITAADVMTPRRLVQAFPESATLGSIRDRLMGLPHSQYPVYGEDFDTVTGVLSLRDALQALVRGEVGTTVGELMRKAMFLPTSRKVDDVLKDVQRAHGKMAIVLDEYGVTEGVITMDDLVEELVGEAIDDMDVTAGLVKRVSRDVALVHGLTRARDVARFLHCPVAWVSEEQENTTITGLLSDALGRIPEPGDELALNGGLHLTVKRADPRMAVRVLARHLREAPPPPPAGDAAPTP
jgi:CBS domain containing-hemolysin-like protein